MRGLLRRCLTGLLRALAALSASLMFGHGSAQDQHTVILRRSYLEHWQVLRETEADGVSRFAAMVQHVVDSRIHAGGEDVLTAVADDLVDLFVTPAYEAEKRLAMRSEPVLGDDAIAEEPGGLSGFRPPFDEGEGRYRHFALNFAAALRAPGPLVDVLARLRGGDLTPEGADDLADIATNEVGREFAAWLGALRPDALADGHSVREWLLEKFGHRERGGE